MLPNNFLNNVSLLEEMKTCFYHNVQSFQTPKWLLANTDLKYLPCFIKGISPTNENHGKYFTEQFIDFCIVIANCYPWLKFNSTKTDKKIKILINLETKDTIIVDFSIDRKGKNNLIGFSHTNDNKFTSHLYERNNSKTVNTFFKKFENLFLLDGLIKYDRLF